MRELKCDFCGAPEPRWKYNASDFETGVPTGDGATWASFSAWIACDACHVLIESDKWERLGERSIERMLKRTGLRLNGRERDVVRLSIDELHKQFRDKRRGSPVKLTPEERDALRRGPEQWREELPGPPPPRPAWMKEM